MKEVRNIILPSSTFDTITPALRTPGISGLILSFFACVNTEQLAMNSPQLKTIKMKKNIGLALQHNLDFWFGNSKVEEIFLHQSITRLV